MYNKEKFWDEIKVTYSSLLLLAVANVKNSEKKITFVFAKSYMK